MFVKLLIAARDNGSKIPAGTVIQVNDEHGLQLITEGYAEAAKDCLEGHVVSSFTDNTKEEEKAQDGTMADATEGENAESGPENNDEQEKIRKALDCQYKKDELAEAAYKLGVEFPAGATKAEIIAAALSQDKAAALMK